MINVPFIDKIDNYGPQDDGKINLTVI